MTGLTSSEANRLGQLEAVIEKGWKGFVEVGSALMEIKQKRLYKESFETFEKYCDDRWAMSSDFAYKLMRAVEVSNDIGGQGKNEHQLRPLSSVPKEERQEVWDDAKEIAAENGREEPTSKDVKAAVAAREEEEEGNDEPDGVLDGAFQEVPDHLCDVFTSGIDDFDAILVDLKNLRRKYNDLVKDPCASRLDHDTRMLWDTLRNRIADARPYAVCCECHGNATLQKVGDLAACSACKGQGWVTEREYKSYSKASA